MSGAAPEVKTVEKEVLFMAPVKEENIGIAEVRQVIMPFDVKEEYWVEEIGHLKKKPVYDFFKRIMDIVASVVALSVSALPMLVVGILIKLDSPGTVFYRQERLGLNGKPFYILKFRTMVMDAEKMGIRWSEGNSDPRTTRIGAFLRKYRIDELPQFWCTLVGTMSLVGPRPERPCYYEAFETYIHGFSQRLMVKPGITGLAQTTGYTIKPEEKIKYDVKYIKNRSLWLDIKLLFKTVVAILTHGDT